MLQPWYATREDVKQALDFKETARNNPAIDRALAAASRSIEGLCHRRFYPETTTRYLDWPDGNYARPWRLWLDANELISATTLTAGGVTLDSGDFFLRRSDRRQEPPYTHIELNLDGPAAFGGTTPQRNIALTGVFGYRDDEDPAGTVAASATAAATELTASTVAGIGVGQLLRIGTERLIVAGKTLSDTGVDLDVSGALTASVADTSVTFSTTVGAPTVGETVTVDAEQMLVVETAGATATVKRAWDGSVLATHTAGTPVFAPRTLTVVRGAAGTTAAPLTAGDAVFAFAVPGPIRQLCIAEAISTLLQERAGWARTLTASGGSTRAAALDALIDLRMQVYTSHGRKARKRAI